jgi:Protein of unknown function (DUF1682)
VGLNEDGATAPYKLLDQESANNFKFFASGRVNVKYCMVNIELRRRQDFIMMFGLGAMMSHKDKISYDIPFNTVGPAPPLCFAIFRKKLEGELIENFKDLKIMGKKLKVEGVSEKLSVISDHPEMAAWFFDKNVKDFLKKYDRLIDMIQVSDRQTFFRTYIDI